MRPVGFSTGALAYSDFRKALELSSRAGCIAVELSALRLSELAPLIDGLDLIDLTGFDYVSIHAPSAFDQAAEPGVCEGLLKQCWRKWPIVVHPDALQEFS